MGRPRTDHSVMVAFRISPELLRDVHRIMDSGGYNRSETLRMLVEEAVEARKVPAP